MIAAIVPIGDPRINGYGNVLPVCLQSFDDFADFVVLVQTHDALESLHPFTRTLNNVHVISNETTWFDCGRYDGKQMDKNLDKAVEFAGRNGAKTAVILSSNWYIPENSRDNLRHTCKNADVWEYLYRGDQLGDQLFSASKRLPMIIEIGRGFRYKFSTDRTTNDFMDIPVQRGDFRDRDSEMVVDVPFEITLDDLGNKINFSRCYSDELPKRNQVFDWDYWRTYYLSKFSSKLPCDLPLGDYGRKIAANTKPEYLSHYFLQEAIHATA